jgi:peptidoglycan/xylan/chitin deacetylase (PgdA/CDA1 family)
MQELRAWANEDSKARPSHRTLNMDEVSPLAKDGLIEVGAHTMTHPVLADLSVAMQREEVIQSKACLERILNRPVTSFAYPHGSYTEETISLVKEAGFTSACSSDTAMVSCHADPFRLPRFSMRDWNGDGFYRWLKELINL